MIYDPLYWYWTGDLPESLCDTIIEQGDKLISADARVGGDNVVGSYIPQIRETNISFFPETHWIEGICTHYAMIANVNSGWNVAIDRAQPVQYARYFPEQHYSPHRDAVIEGKTPVMRKLSVAIQLSEPDSYEGGNFAIGEGCDMKEIPEFRRRGSIIVFPSICTHGITPIISGVRHSLVCWIVGPRYR